MENKEIHNLDQAAAMIADTLPPMWKRMYDRLLEEGFDADKAMQILKAYVAGSAGGGAKV
jgi:hypothetical protein